MSDSNCDRRVRLQKYLAAQGLGSRRSIEAMISSGEVLINGTTAELGAKVDPWADQVRIRGRQIRPRRVESVILLLNKPRGVICSHGDPHHSRTIYDLVPPPWSRERLLCAGRLDKESEGMIILTNDGDLMQRLTHPSQKITKRYHVTLSRPFQLAHRSPILQGFEDEGEFIRAEKLIPLSRDRAVVTELEVHLEHGKKREIRRLFERYGYFVNRLQRFQIGGLVLRGVGVGRLRRLSESEAERLFQ